MEVHRTLGPGFLEPVYQDALSIECALRGMPYSREVELPIHYKGKLLSTNYRIDFIMYHEVLVELKALALMTTREEAQIINYLKATGMTIGLLLNFGAKSLEFRRFVLTGNSTRRLFYPD